MKRLTCIDLFAGAGGSTTGIQMTGLVDVVACINHDPLAIRSHAENHPNCRHYNEDITSFDEHRLPQCDIITMSAPCPHFSIAKGDAPKDEKIRSLSTELYRYIDWCEPKIIIVENVKEFMTWGPLKQKTDKNGTPVCKENGEPYLITDTDSNKLGSNYKRWIQTIKAKGYEYQSRLLNSADFGAYTSRLRYFGVFVKQGLHIRFPQPTHAKNPPKGSGIAKWKAVKDLLDFSDRGKSIFERKKPLEETTLKRIYAGLLKFVVLDESAWIVKFLSNNPKTGTNKGVSIEEPLHTINTQGRLNLATVEFIDEYKTRKNGVSSTEEPLHTITTEGNKSLVTAFLDKYYGVANAQSIDKPCDTITTKDRFSLVQVEAKEQDFLIDFYGNSQDHSIDEPLPTIATKDKFALMQVEAENPKHFIMNDYSRGGEVSDVESVCPTILTNPKQNLVTAEFSFLTTDNFANDGIAIDQPHPTIMACDKNTWLITPDFVGTKAEIKPTDSPYTQKIKQFMQDRGIADIYMRMLCVDKELKVIQGFPADYKLLGTRKDKKRFVGNSVVPLMMERIAESLIEANRSKL